MISAEEQHVLNRLSAIGIDAEKLPESTGRTPDIAAYDPATKYVIEVKTRTDDETVVRELKETGEAYRVSPIGPTNTAGTIFQDAIGQLSAYGDREALKVIWLCVRSRRGATSTLADQLRHTLYGISRVAGGGVGAKAPPCYYFHESVFFRYRQLVGVILDLGDRGALCINNHSDRANDLKRSVLARSFGGAVFDPVEQERAGHCLIADCQIDRRDSEAVLQFISDKYGIEYAVHFNLDEHAGFGTIPAPE